MKSCLSIDKGFGYTKIAIIEDGKLKPPTKEIDTVAYLHGYTKEDFEKSNGDVIYHDDKYYMVGSNALQAVKSYDHIIDSLDYNGFRNISAFVIKKHWANNGGKFSNLVVSLSPAYADYSTDYKEYIAKELEMDPAKVLVIPQGAGAKIALENVGMNPNTPTSGDLFRNYLLFDIGFNTIDVVHVVNGVSPSGNRDGYPGWGVVRVAEKLKEYVKSEFRINLTMAHMRNIISLGQYTIHGKVYQMEDRIKKYTREYISEIVKFIRENYQVVVNEIDNVFFVGGGAELLKQNKEFLLSEFAKKFSRASDDFFKIPEDGSEYYNAIGGAYYGYKSLKG